jgi:hypothetical protein
MGSMRGHRASKGRPKQARTVRPELLTLLTRSEDQRRRSSGGIDAQPGAIGAQPPKNEHLWPRGSDSAAETDGIRHTCSSSRKVSTYGADEPLWGDAEDERAAIVEHEGAIPREWADGFARLDPDRPPGDVPPTRWLRFLDDVGRFLDSPFCSVAAALGWGPLELFGCDRDRPFGRIDWAGLLWLLDGDRLVALTSEMAIIETGTGIRQVFRRGSYDPGRVLAWELLR